MKKLDTKIAQQQEQQGKSIRLVSFTFQVPDRKLTQRNGGLYRYDYK